MNTSPSTQLQRFRTTMAEVTRPMPVTQRLFSKFIHAPAVARVGDAIGSTVARPNALLFGAIASFSLTLMSYLLAKNLGYSLSGFESIGAFILGWIFGLAYDLLKLMVTGKH
jgi:hypothetical protein